MNSRRLSPFIQSRVEDRDFVRRVDNYGIGFENLKDATAFFQSKFRH